MIRVEAGKNLTFATPSLRVKAGEPIRLVFKNPDVVPHNWVLVKPGTLKKVGTLANQLIADPDALLRNYVPATKDVLVYTDIVATGGDSQHLLPRPGREGTLPVPVHVPRPLDGDERRDAGRARPARTRRLTTGRRPAKHLVASRVYGLPDAIWDNGAISFSCATPKTSAHESPCRRPNAPRSGLSSLEVHAIAPRQPPSRPDDCSSIAA